MYGYLVVTLNLLSRHVGSASLLPCQVQRIIEELLGFHLCNFVCGIELSLLMTFTLSQ